MLTFSSSLEHAPNKSALFEMLGKACTCSGRSAKNCLKCTNFEVSKSLLSMKEISL